MPELPEVESLRMGLSKVLIGKEIKDVKVLMGKLVSGSGTKRFADQNKIKEFQKKLKGKKISSVKRIAKNIIIEMQSGEIVLVHLKMTGQLVFSTSAVGRESEEGTKDSMVAGGHPITDSYTKTLPHKHTHIIFELDNGTLYYNDVRQFGYVLYFKNMQEALKQKQFDKIGLEPFDKNFSLKYFKEKISKKNKNIKSVLLEQDVVVGCGNIYADEICFASKVLPSRNCKTLTDTEINLIYKNIPKILSLAIAHGGSSISDYLLADGSRGNYARLHKVYGKSGLPCYVCKNILEKETIATRTTVYCKNCQK